MSYGNNEYAGHGYSGAPEPQTTVSYYSSPYVPQQGDQHEMQPFVQGQDSNVLSINDFLNRVRETRDEIRSLRNDAEQLAALHNRTLAVTSSLANSPEQQALDQLSATTKHKSNALRAQIRDLRADTEQTADQGSFKLKKSHVESLSNEFRDELRFVIAEDQRYKDLCREQISRQYRIANPDANEDEVRAAANQDWGNEGVFQAALRSERSAQADGVLRNIRSRHAELKHIEQSIVELLGLFQDLDTLIVQQGQLITNVASQADRAQDDLEKANGEINNAVKISLSTRRKKWWCVLIVVLIVLIIALAVGLAVGLKKATQ
ncbi:syntaxin-like protein psy1 [Podospora didyma]|uniref:Syntaxin-like protein psy1 n=1 Tax=Podospora didyma TaxID=330526 RepID=A0AAE0K2K5_9PEZI|nr:syntaxin-like protein psy1 [Podospora didyma]